MNLDSKVMIGALNTAYQAEEWMRNLNDNGISCSMVLSKSRSSRFKQKASATIPNYRFSSSLTRSKKLFEELNGVTHILNESLFPFFLSPKRFTFLEEKVAVETGDRVLGVVFHGSDIRSPLLHMDRNSLSWYQYYSSDEIARLEAAYKRRKSRLSETNIHTFVTTPDLLHDLPEAQYLPLCVDTSFWKPESLRLMRGPLRILHLPSKRNPPIKGTLLIDKYMEKFRNSKYVKYVSFTKNVLHDDMKRIYNDFDVVIDQIMGDSYGVTAVEAMSCGKIVISTGAETMRRKTNLNPPIIDATNGDLGSALDRILDEPINLESWSELSRNFILSVHSGAHSIESLKTFLNSGDSKYYI